MNPEIGVALTLGLLLAGGLALALPAGRLGVPRVLGYVLAGVILSPKLLGGVLGLDFHAWAGTLTDLALGIVAYIIGGAITWRALTRTGRVIGFTVLGEALGAMVLVFLVLWGLLGWLAGGLHQELPPADLALVLAAISATTAPAVTVAVLHQYRASGTLSSTLLGVVALDDALGIVLFVLALTATTGLGLGDGIVIALREIAGGLLLGLAAGRALSLVSRRLHATTLRLPVIVTAILLVTGLAQLLHFSPLLAAMALGFFARHFLRAHGDRLFAPVEHLEELVFLIFFTVAGTHFDPAVFAANLWLILAYFLARSLGKTAGAALGATLAGAPGVVIRWLGPALMPQAGVAVGLALTLTRQPAFAAHTHLIVNVILGSTILNEILGPLAVRRSLGRAGELGERRRRKS